MIDFLRHHRQLVFDLERLKQRFFDYERTAMMIQTTFYDLYGLPQHWHHVVAVFKSGSSEEYYDGLHAKISEEENGHIKPLAGATGAWSLKGHKIVLWLKQ